MGLSGSGLDVYYYIIFDESDIVIEIFVGSQPGG